MLHLVFSLFGVSFACELAASRSMFPAVRPRAAAVFNVVAAAPVGTRYAELDAWQEYEELRPTILISSSWSPS